MMARCKEASPAIDRLLCRYYNQHMQWWVLQETRLNAMQSMSKYHLLPLRPYCSSAAAALLTFARGVLSSASSRFMSSPTRGVAVSEARTRQVARQPATCSAAAAAGPVAFSGRQRCSDSTWRRAGPHCPAAAMHSRSSTLQDTCRQEDTQRSTMVTGSPSVYSTQPTPPSSHALAHSTQE